MLVRNTQFFLSNNEAIAVMGELIVGLAKLAIAISCFGYWL
ncbi:MULTISPECIES: hypothetical protein [unclassified Nostoc]|nr:MULTISPECIES: hypothetical protein [unclassified Nostoc]